MQTFCKLSIFVALASVGLISCARADVKQNAKPLVSLGVDGRLIYAPANQRGDTIPDFSNVGYKGGGVAVPDAPVRETVAPDGDGKDDLARLQIALDKVAALPLDVKGIRGALLVKKGRYLLGDTLQIRASGVVLRGEGQGEDGTVLVATKREQYSLIQMSGQGKLTEIKGTRQNITDDYVPVGARSLRVQNAANFKVGDEILVQRPSTANWISALGMDRIAPDKPGLVQWKAGSKDLKYERTITAIEGDRITLDAPLVNALQREFGGGFVYKIEFPGRIENVGIENLRGESEFDASIRDKSKKDQFADENHGWDCVKISATRDAWVRNVTSRYFGYSCVNISGSAQGVTVSDCHSLTPVSRVEGGRRYSFNVSGALNLVRDCTAEYGRHDFVNSATVPGPNVFLNCQAKNAYTDSGPHHRWATGTLFDNVVTDGALNVQNRGNSGTGHGWAGSQMVFWNCVAGSMDVQSPPTSENYAIGCITKRASGDGYWASLNEPATPRSLYLSQLKERLG